MPFIHLSIIEFIVKNNQCKSIEVVSASDSKKSDLHFL